MKIVHVPTPCKFVEAMEEAKKTYKLVFALFTGEKAADGSSWCPDCVRADPIIKKHLETLPDVCLLECAVKRSEYKGNPKYPYRCGKFRVAGGIPTLHWVNAPSGFDVPPVGEKDCSNDEMVKMWVSFVKESISK
ncbi:hypothetical protein ADUPG1_012472 [Aduncisulcus paluster]|uniref:Thioredoxin domain-containing protein n=1 Tax=Aduncisulcus paluster TaxID=2918883 RepID=A0ABQ5K2W1_9EUKA|nr:hypothetical protein ADUPG1_012472 [Aduncisulcus paluster]